MVGEMPLVDAHVHLPRLTALPPFWFDWARRHGQVPLEELYGTDGHPIPEKVDAYFAAEGVDVVLLLPEYSPRTVGVHPYEDLLPLVAHNPRRFRFLASLNPHLHYPAVVHLERQLEAGAVGYLLKEEAPEAIVEAIRAAARGGMYFSPGVADLVRAVLEGKGPAKLTDREREVLRLMAEGLS
ncbi:MAG: hypothetical protein NZ846_11960, partial [Thermus sp.]|nr:hypothetical protein [Thermus sp.]